MASLTNISCNVTLNDANACFKSKMDPSDVTRPILGVIAVLSFVCNGILCAVMLKTLSMLRKSYNVLIFVLAVTDCLTGLFSLYTLIHSFYLHLPNLSGFLLVHV